VSGVGPSAFARAIGHGAQSHHLYGQILGEMGSIGAVAFTAMVLAYGLNFLEIRRWKRDFPEYCPEFAIRVAGSVGIVVMLLLVMGFGGHNLYRYTWMWFGAFQAAAIQIVRRQAASGEVVAPSLEQANEAVVE
jgi:hypothetical protein